MAREWPLFQFRVVLSLILTCEIAGERKELGSTFLAWLIFANFFMIEGLPHELTAFGDAPLLGDFIFGSRLLINNHLWLYF